MRYKISRDTVMTPQLLAKYINLHKKDVSKRNRVLQDAYENKYKIFGAPKKEDYKPDVRISANFAKYLTDTFVGFFCGVPIKINSDDSNIDEYLGRLSLYNDEDNHNLELAKGADIHGDYHELLYVDEDAEICYTEVSPLQSFFWWTTQFLSDHYFLSAITRIATRLSVGRGLIQHMFSTSQRTQV